MTAAVSTDPLSQIHAAAACHGLDPDLFFPEYSWLIDERVVGACRSCPVRELCLQWALDHFEQGVWGGLTEEQRNAVNQQRHRVRCPDCRSDAVTSDGDAEVCLSCGLSWRI